MVELNTPTPHHRRGIRSWLRHLVLTNRALAKMFPQPLLARVSEQIRAAEQQHRAELRIVIEGRLNPRELAQGLAPRARAEELFAHLRVWDTADNCGVLLYILVADRAIELVADRGSCSSELLKEWGRIVNTLEGEFAARNHAVGLVSAVAAVNHTLIQAFPRGSESPKRANELCDTPLLIL
jgi:uncharacterized membrane protein